MLTELSGILLLDKPTGITSNKILQQVKKLCNTKSKAGHTGSLDPLATGMLPICFGEATKFSGFLLNSDKKYLVTAQFGIKTDTGDVDGKIIAKREVSETLGIEEIQSVVGQFIGEIWQKPPIYSAIKQNGVRLYKLAREQKIDDNSINVLPRLIKIYEIKLIEFCFVTKGLILEIHCSKGTYIRSVINDLANQLNSLATVKKLRRVAVGNFVSSQMISYANLEKQISTLKQLLLPVTECLADLPVVVLNNVDQQSLKNGKIIVISHISEQFSVNTLICLMTTDQKLIGVGEILVNDQIIAKRLVKIV